MEIRIVAVVVDCPWCLAAAPLVMAVRILIQSRKGFRFFGFLQFLVSMQSFVTQKGRGVVWGSLATLVIANSYMCLPVNSGFSFQILEPLSSVFMLSSLEKPARYD